MCLHDYVNAVWSLKGIKGLYLFTLVTFFHQKVLITPQNMQNVFHLKLGDSHKLSYGPTSTSSRHIFHQHDWFIASHQFLTCKYGWPFVGDRLWSCIDFHSNFELTWCLVTSPFSFILLHCTFPWSMVCFLIKIYRSLIIIIIIISMFFEEKMYSCPLGITKKNLKGVSPCPIWGLYPSTESMKHMKEAPFLEVAVAVISRLPKLNVVLKLNQAQPGGLGVVK